MSQTAAFETSRYKAADGAELFAGHWRCDDARAAVLIVHGFAEHSLRYAELARALNNAGYTVFAYDHRHHGQSPGEFGHIQRFDALIDDLDEVVEQFRASVPQLPLFIFAHSMGGLVTANYLVRYKPANIRGVVFSAALVKPAENVSPVLQKISGLIAALLPKLPVHAVDPEAISRDPAEVRKYVEDPLVYHGKIGARTGNEWLKAMRALEGRFDAIRQPLWIVHGSADRLIEPAASELLHQEAGSADKTYRLFEGAYHEIHNDLDQETLYAALVTWLDAHR